MRNDELAFSAEFGVDVVGVFRIRHEVLLVRVGFGFPEKSVFHFGVLPGPRAFYGVLTLALLGVLTYLVNIGEGLQFLNVFFLVVVHHVHGFCLSSNEGTWSQLELRLPVV